MSEPEAPPNEDENPDDVEAYESVGDVPFEEPDEPDQGDGGPEGIEGGEAA